MIAGLHQTVRRAFAPAFVAVALAAPRLAEACSVCMSGREDENKLAFILTTIFLTVTPLGLIGGAILYIRSYVRRAEQATERRDPAHRSEPEPSRWAAPARGH